MATTNETVKEYAYQPPLVRPEHVYGTARPHIPSGHEKTGSFRPATYFDIYLDKALCVKRWVEHTPSELPYFILQESVEKPTSAPEGFCLTDEYRQAHPNEWVSHHFTKEAKRIERKTDTEKKYWILKPVLKPTDNPSRWEVGFRNIVTALLGPREKFEIDDIVAQVKELKELTARTVYWKAECSKASKRANDLYALAKEHAAERDKNAKRVAELEEELHYVTADRDSWAEQSKSNYQYGVEKAKELTAKIGAIGALEKSIHDTKQKLKVSECDVQIALNANNLAKKEVVDLLDKNEALRVAIENLTEINRKLSLSVFEEVKCSHVGGIMSEEECVICNVQRRASQPR